MVGVRLIVISCLSLKKVIFVKICVELVIRKNFVTLWPKIPQSLA